MKLRNISSLVVAAAALGFANSASALLPFTSGTPNVPDIIVNISGASAQQKTLGALVTSTDATLGFCQSGTLHTFYDRPDGNLIRTSGSSVSLESMGKKWRSYYCTLSNTNPTLTTAGINNKTILVNNRSAGGSIWGVVPVQGAWPVEYMNIFANAPASADLGTHCDTGANLLAAAGYNSGTDDKAKSLNDDSVSIYCLWESNRAATTQSNGTTECPINTAYQAGGGTYVGSVTAHLGTTVTNTVCLKSDGGISDVEPALFDGENLPVNWTALTSSQLGTLDVTSSFAVVFGVSITENAYRDLQQSQGRVTYASASDPTDWTDDKMPSLPKTAISSFMASNSNVPGFTLIDSAVSDLSAGQPNNTLGDITTRLCRRVKGSGTQAAQNVFFMDDPCGAPYNQKMSDADEFPFIGGNFYAKNVILNSGSGDVIDCQNESFDGTGAFVGYKADAMGFNAIEKQPDHAGGDRWNYIKIDGVLPSVENAVSGDYTHWYANTFNWLNSGVNAPAGDVLAALQYIADNSAQPTILKASGAKGVAALSSKGFSWGPETATEAAVVRPQYKVKGDSCSGLKYND